MSLIQEAWDGKTPEKDEDLTKLVDSIAGKEKTESGRTTPSGAGGAAPS